MVLNLRSFWNERNNTLDKPPHLTIALDPPIILKQSATGVSESESVPERWLENLDEPIDLGPRTDDDDDGNGNADGAEEEEVVINGDASESTTLIPVVSLRSRSLLPAYTLQSPGPLGPHSHLSDRYTTQTQMKSRPFTWHHCPAPKLGALPSVCTGA